MTPARVVAFPEPCPLRRRGVLRQLLGLPWIGLAAAGTACAIDGPDPPAAPGSSSARARLHESAMAHGLTAWRQHHDLNASFSSAWSAESGWLTAGTDAAAATQLRLLPAAGLLAVRYGQGDAQALLLRPATGSGQSEDAAAQDPLAAFDAETLCLLLLGPMALLDRAGVVNWAEPASLDGRRCDQLLLTAAPGLGLAPASRLALFIDRDRGLLRRLRLAPDAATQAWRGLTEVDFFDHFSLHGMVWPRRFQSPSRRWWPGGPAQSGWLTGLDLDRGYSAGALQGPRWTGEAAAPARPLPPA